MPAIWSVPAAATAAVTAGWSMESVTRRSMDALLAIERRQEIDDATTAVSQSADKRPKPVIKHVACARLFAGGGPTLLSVCLSIAAVSSIVQSQKSITVSRPANAPAGNQSCSVESR